MTLLIKRVTKISNAVFYSLICVVTRSAQEKINISTAYSQEIIQIYP